MPDSPVVVLTALDVEYRAVRAQLDGIEQQRHPSGTLFEVGRPRRGGPKVVLGLTGTGNTSAAVIAERAITWSQAREVLFVGIAGGLRWDINLGDVVVATRIYSYHSGLEQDEGFLARPRTWEANHGLLQLAHQVNRDRPEGVFFGPIASGEVVLNSPGSPLASQLHRTYNDTVAIEMESAGIAQAAHLNEVRVLTVRGISDRADGSKYDTDGDGWQPIAARNAAEFALALVSALDGTRPQPASPPPRAFDGLDWRAPQRSVDIQWRRDRRGRLSTFEDAALEVHLAVAEPGSRIEVRRLATLPGELVTLGREHELFTPTEQVRTDTGGDWAIVEATDHRRVPVGLAVLRTGQRSVWEPLPRDTVGPVLDPEDLVPRIERLLGLLAVIAVARPDRIVPAIAVEPATSLSEDSVRSMPRDRARVSMKDAVRVRPQESLPYQQIVSHRTDVAEELAARLLVEFRAH